MTGRRTIPWWTAPVAAAGVFIAALSVVDDVSALALVNESPSLPRGLYIRAGAAVEHGSIVAISQPAVARPYLTHLGMPGDVVLLKRVAALGGDHVCAVDGVVQTPRRRARALERDRRGAVLPAWRECRLLAPDEVFLLGDTPGSFDSRYFGPVRRSDVAGVYREILTW
jgi:conjugative transfer signal peptidase TraF